MEKVVLSRADLSSSDSCCIEVTEYPKLPAANPREDKKVTMHVTMHASMSTGRKIGWTL